MSDPSDGSASVPPKGRLVVLVGPSGVGKSTIVRRLKETIPGLYFSVSATTRSPRAGETDGVDYHFVDRARFEAMIADGELLEWAEIHGGLQMSGTPAAPVRQALEAGRPVLVEVDVAGARQIRTTLPEAVFVFLAPPDWQTLVDRLGGRGTEDTAIVERRLETARTELAAQDEFEHVVVNDDLDAAVAALARLLTP